jgi:hypothetical protein
MPLTSKGHEIMANMKRHYGEEKGEEVFYRSANAGTITGVHDDEQADTPQVSPNPRGMSPQVAPATTSIAQ